ncbi:MAG: hypothetical protein PHH01_02285 [Patescibacteria group bacterium]|nr:hypothetical protein [Patescibacteria group bacterium]
MKRHGYLITIYGVNNLGKSTQAKMLVEFLNRNSWPTEYVKYPAYRIAPTGPFINRILRSRDDQPINENEFQMWCTLNRFQCEPALQKKLAAGKIVVAEDYIGTCLAWGATKGADLDWLVEINQPLVHEDLAILIDGERFINGKEKKHIHENDDILIERCRRWHQKLASMYGWKMVNANQTITQVNEDILEIVSQFLRGKDIWQKDIWQKNKP